MSALRLSPHRACHPLLAKTWTAADPASCSWPGREQRGSALPKRPIILYSGGEGRRKASRDGRGKRGLCHTAAMQLCSNCFSVYVWGRSNEEVGRVVVVGTEGWASKTSVILSSMLSHHRTNGLWDFYSPKTRDGKRCQLACDQLLFICAVFFPSAVGHLIKEWGKKWKTMNQNKKSNQIILTLFCMWASLAEAQCHI